MTSSSLFSFSSRYPIITCRVSPPTSPSVVTSLPLPSSSSSYSLACSLQCPHFQSCSGCTQEFNLHRPAVVDEASGFFKRYGVEDFTFDSCRLWGWRCRAKLAVRGTSDNALIGLYQEGTHTVVDIPECKSHHPNINAAIELLREGIKVFDVVPFDEDQGTGDLRYVQMAVTTHSTNLRAPERYKNGKVQVSLVWNSRNERSHNADKLQALSSYLWRKGGPNSKFHLIHSVWANFQTSTNNIIFGNRWRHLLGERDFWEHVGGIDISLDPSSFGQANTRAFDSLLWKLHKYVPGGSSVADLYAGAGVIGLSLATSRKCSSVKCIEVNKEARLSFEKTIQRLPNSLNCSISWHHADASVNPLSWIIGSDVVVVDPPRRGLDASLRQMLESVPSIEKRMRSSSQSSNSNTKEEKRPWILRAKELSIQAGNKLTPEENNTLPQRLIYISCGWESFKEDCKSLLSSRAWELEKAHGFNFFPGTDSIEVLAVFKRRVAIKKKKKSGIKKVGIKKVRAKSQDSY
ncbi:S-adenosyl-L-methionine-dependent methyltransferase [Arabidopsis thaliana x Arabidopsis arenosa]|uniref:S-adenosyl-L-methionine-dependent methyltransferase n=1 Tax=Arabidopsis thaliana x Arabidopsis arenosa TaxID=1240361 RepID=A0A8T1ZIA9_9BRAS|nr:S-adenosyl-L-methionine-dependent methyltransferase [Arabidopsis thaliana x Arabidopsis arenosa]